MPGSGKHIAKGKGVHREVESEGSPRQTLGLTNRNHIRQLRRISLHYKVKSNKGSAGIDGITTEELLEYLKENKNKILGQIRARKYKPKPVKRVQIPISNG